MGAFENLLGRTFERLLVEERAGNCEWATVLTQARNKTNNRRVIYLGREMCIGELAALTEQPYMRLWARIVIYGWSAERAVLPVDARRGDGHARHAA